MKGLSRKKRGRENPWKRRILLHSKDVTREIRHAGKVFQGQTNFARLAHQRGAGSFQGKEEGGGEP